MADRRPVSTTRTSPTEPRTPGAGKQWAGEGGYEPLPVGPCSPGLADRLPRQPLSCRAGLPSSTGTHCLLCYWPMCVYALGSQTGRNNPRGREQCLPKEGRGQEMKAMAPSALAQANRTNTPGPARGRAHLARGKRANHSCTGEGNDTLDLSTPSKRNKQPHTQSGAFTQLSRRGRPGH